MAENAESLTERRAQVQEYEARVEEVASREAKAQAQLQELYRHNAEEEARYEKEREEMLGRLKMSEAKVRIPR